MNARLHAPSRLALAMLIALAAALSACAATSSTPSTPNASPAPTAVPSPSSDPRSIPPSDGPSARPPLSDADLAKAMAFRQEFGLRSDEAWVRAVAANPAAVLDFGVPLLPFERDDIQGRATGDDAVVAAVRGYLERHADVSGGLYIDQARGGIVTALVTDEPAAHEAAIREAIGGAARIAVRQVRWTEAELLDLQERITADQAFLAGLPARMTTSSVDIIGNRVELSISSAVPDAAIRIATRHGAQAGQLAVRSDGTGLLLQPTGRIEGRIVAPPGTDMSTLAPQAEADVDIGPRDAVGIEVKKDGRFTLDRMPPTTYTVTVLLLGGDGPQPVGSARVSVPPGGVGTVEIPVRLP